jgi:hypothetical protein
VRVYVGLDNTYDGIKSQVLEYEYLDHLLDVQSGDEHTAQEAQSIIAAWVTDRTMKLAKGCPYAALSYANTIDICLDAIALVHYLKYLDMNVKLVLVETGTDSLTEWTMKARVILEALMAAGIADDDWEHDIEVLIMRRTKEEYYDNNLAVL